MENAQLTAYDVKTKQKGVPIQDAVIKKTAKGAFMVQGHNGAGGKLTTLVSESKAVAAVNAGVAKWETDELAAKYSGGNVATGEGGNTGQTADASATNAEGTKGEIPAGGWRADEGQSQDETDQQPSDDSDTDAEKS